MKQEKTHGKITDSGVYVKFEDEKQKLRMSGGAWSIKIAEIEGRDLRQLVFITSKAHYKLDPQVMLDKGFERVLGGERKWVVPLKHWEVVTHDTTRKT